jgi:predicted Zn-dependent protease with MMP-like domain
MSYSTLTEHEWDEVDRVWDLLEQSEIERARLTIDGLLAKRPGHPDLRIVSAAVAIDEGEAERALRTLEGAERSADPAHFFHLRAVARYELARFEPARVDAERALAVRADMAETHELLSKILEFTGDLEGSQRHGDWARELDPEQYPPILEVADDEFDALVVKSLAELEPAKLRRHLDEVPVLVQPLPAPEMLTAEQPPLSPDILGLWVGQSITERRHDDVPGVPAAIYLFRRNLLRACADREELAHEVRVTVRHEVGHMLGRDEDELEEWGLA